MAQLSFLFVLGGEERYYDVMDPARGAAAAIVLGSALIALGLVPAPLVRLTVARFKDEMRQFGDSLPQSPIPPPSYRDAQNEAQLPEQIWLVIGGAALLALGMLALVSN
jgi:hypothetical protein